MSNEGRWHLLQLRWRGGWTSLGHSTRSLLLSSVIITASMACGVALAAGCGPAQPTQAPMVKSTTTLAKPKPTSPGSTASSKPTAENPTAEFDICEGSPPIPHPYTGILRVARCDQDMFITMAGVASQLGVKCNYCHVPHPTDPKKEDYPVMTPKKEIANWMNNHFMAALKQADGSPMKCRSCHTDEHGKPVAKILGSPRDPVKAQEWMSMVMVNKFVTTKGDKLKCKSCHGGNFATPTFKAKVILQTEQIPPH